MKEKNIREQFEKDLLELANHYSLLRVKVNTINFDLDYKRNAQGQFYLASEKAVIRVLGKVTKVPIGENEKYKTYEEAEKPTKAKWQEYYRKVRAKRTDAEKRAEALRLKRYRLRKKEDQEAFEQRQ